jgi:uncharacterized protein with HEPN domain
MRPDDVTRIRHRIEAAEAASRITQETQAMAPSVPWAAIVAMRNRIIHAYFDIDRDIVWKTALEEVPPLRLQLVALLPAA